MLIGEPPQSQGDLHFRLFGIPVRIHPMFWVMSLLLGLNGAREPVFMLLWVVAVLLSVLAHELGHALAARAYGWQPRITLYAFGGLASYQPTRRNPLSQILILLAGPGAGFVFAALIVLALGASGLPVYFQVGGEGLLDWKMSPGLDLRLTWLLWQLLYVNIFWGLLNLLPVFPLDGGQITYQLLEIYQPHDSLRVALWTSIIMASGLAVLAYIRLHDWYLALMFAYLAYTNYQTIEGAFGRGGGRWGGGG